VDIVKVRVLVEIVNIELQYYARNVPYKTRKH